jgi:3-demethoxyubiquinol 3-hydroxylase
MSKRMSIDQAIVELDRALRAICAPARSIRPLPGADLPDVQMDAERRRRVAGLMRVNHCGEICAQALYQGQALTSRDERVRQALRVAADEETEHLAWTEQRIDELGGRKSLLNPLWYSGALALGLVAGVCGDKWNLGFLAETERQVEEHLDGHLEVLPAEDERSRAIVEQMRNDEMRHAEMAMAHGAAELPAVIKLAMKVSARLMTGLAYRL